MARGGVAAPAVDQSGQEGVECPNTLSWQGAFWTVFAMALNTMTLPSGKVLGLPSSYNFALRCSPIVCAVSVIDTLGRLVTLSLEFKSLPQGLYLWTLERFDETDEVAKGSFDEMRENHWFTLLLFLLGMVPAIVKMFAVHGIPWTTAWCACYLLSFGVDATVMMLAFIWAQKPQDQLTASRITRWTLGAIEFLSGVALMFSLIFAWSLLRTWILPSDDDLVTWRWVSIVSQSTVFVLGTIVSTIWLFELYILEYYCISPNIWYLFGGGTIILVNATVVAIFWPDIYLGWRLGTATCVLGYVWLIGPVINWRLISRTRVTTIATSTSFILLHLLAAISQYATVYDSSSTSVPDSGWIAYLG